MRHTTLIICLTIAFGLLASPARSSDYQDMDICLGKQIIARILCKDAIEVNYVSKVRDNIYLFSVFYANKEARFFVGVYENMIRVQGKDYQTVTRSIPYHFDASAKCGIVDYSPPDCTNHERIVCCSQKTTEEELDEKFWDRPIPDLLEEDLRNALKSSNATQPPEKKDKPEQ